MFTKAVCPIAQLRGRGVWVPAFAGTTFVEMRASQRPFRSSRSASPRLQRAGWVERLVRRSSKSEGGSDTHHVVNDGDGFREGLNPSYASATCLTAAPCGIRGWRGLLLPDRDRVRSAA